MLTSSDRSKFLGLSNKLRDLVFIGKEGLTPNINAQIMANLRAHELIKIKVLKNAPTSIAELAREIAEECECDVVNIIGSKIIVYKYSDKEGIDHII